ncbi:hypothetical protein M0R45_030376 [Rubus argutus]|uniref:PB1 domain-containing protein n=1 Tax=Rubus argutus TaxID=59490 RepID=A0AAW1WBN5_RUBAR
MSNSKFGRFTYGAETVLISLSSSTRFDELCSQLSLRFRKLKVGQFVLRYSLTDCPNCFLESDDDLCLMLEIFQVMNSPYIEIQILDVGSSSSTCSVDSEHFSDVVKHALDIRHHHDEESDVSSDDSNFEDDNNMIIGNFVSNNKRKYMSSNKDIFPFAFAIVDAESKENWRYPSCYGAGYKDHILRLFGQCAYARTRDIFDERLEELKREGRGQINSFLENLLPENYAIAYFPAKRYGEMSNALAESFNNVIKDARCMPLPSLLEFIRVDTMEKLAKRKTESSTWRSILCPKFEKKLKKRLDTGRNWRANKLPYLYIEDYWKTSFYRNAHELPIWPVPDLDKPSPASFGDSGLLPPKTRKPPGRPKTRRIRSFGEEPRQIRCSRCHKLGHHNRKSCNVPIQD